MRSLVGPLELEFDLLLAPLPFVLDVELGTSGHVDPFSGHLDLEPLARLEGVGQPAQLRYELGGGVDPLDIPVQLFAHQFSPFRQTANLPVSYRVRSTEPNPRWLTEVLITSRTCSARGGTRCRPRSAVSRSTRRRLR